MYSPKIAEELIPDLYRWAKSDGVTMTSLVNRIIKNEIENIQRKEKSNEHQDERDAMRRIGSSI
jgi:hypothetical protein